MTTFADAAAAEKSLVDNKFTYTEWDKTKQAAVTKTAPHDSAVYLKDYAKAAAFLCDAGRFETALGTVSKKLWEAYLKLDPLTKNKFTRALGAVAVSYGFDYQNRFQLQTDAGNIAGNPDTAPIGILLIGGDPQLGYMLRGKFFWKDSMDSRHGEHSHSLQWLAIAEGAGLGAGAAELYSHTGNYRAPSQSDTKGARSFVLWQWLADCFPEDKKKAAGDSKFLNGEQLISNSYRSPQIIMDHLLMGNPRAKMNHFVSTYLYARYKSRGWLAEVSTFDPATNTTTKAVTDIQTKDIKEHGKAKAVSGGWKKSDASPEARMNRDPAKYTSKMDTPKGVIKMKFHGIVGNFHHDS